MANASSGGDGKQVSSTTEQAVPDVECLIENDKNCKSIVCRLCSSNILKPDSAELVDKKFFLPSMHQKTKVSLENPEGDELIKHWMVKGMMTFENVGFSHTVKNIKYLTCADCEVGPIGWHDIQDSTTFYVALDRVSYQ